MVDKGLSYGKITTENADSVRQNLIYEHDLAKAAECSGTYY